MNVGEWKDKWLPKLKHEERMNCDVQRGVNKSKNKKSEGVLCATVDVSQRSGIQTHNQRQIWSILVGSPVRLG
jgi:hypothetical protein